MKKIIVALLALFAFTTPALAQVAQYGPFKVVHTGTRACGVGATAPSGAVLAIVIDMSGSGPKLGISVSNPHYTITPGGTYQITINMDGQTFVWTGTGSNDGKSVHLVAGDADDAFSALLGMNATSFSFRFADVHGHSQIVNVTGDANFRTALRATAFCAAM